MNSTKDNPIGFFDSGIGGTSIWKEVHKLLPNDIFLKTKKTNSALKNDSKRTHSRILPPNGTLCRFKYKGNEYTGRINNGKFSVNGYGTFTSLSSASIAVSKTSRNGWRDWELKIPGAKLWILADIWRGKS